MEKDSLSIFIQRWITQLEGGRLASNHTLYAYSSDVHQFLKFFQNHLGKSIELEELACLTKADLRSWLTYRIQKEYEMRSTARGLSAVKSFIRFLQTEKKIEDHSVFSLRPPRMRRTLPRPLSQHQAIDVVDNISILSKEEWVGERDKALFSLIYSTGLRISEALALNLSDVQKKDAIMVRGKRGKFRRVPLLPVVQNQLEHYRKKVPVAFTSFIPLFLGVRGKRLHVTIADRQMKKYRELKGLPNSATPHAFRHSCATHLMEASGDMRAIQELLGHASLSTTQIYTDINREYLMRTYEKTHPRAGHKKKD